MPEVLSHKSKLPEVLWNFSRFKGEKRLTLKQNPHFYEFSHIPTTVTLYHGGFKANPIENFRPRDAKFWVITDKPSSRIFLETPQQVRAFGNVWRVPYSNNNDVIIFKGSSMTLFFSFLPS